MPFAYKNMMDQNSGVPDQPKPKKSLGQHFLINKKALLTVAESLRISAEDTIIEIGPGHGELTDILIASPAQKIIVIEKDHDLAELLKEKYRSVGTTKDSTDRLTVIEGDALKDLAPIIANITTPYVLAGNIPYYITGYLLRIIGDASNKPLRTIFTIQKEVAERMCAVAPKANRLSSCVQIWGTPKIAMKLKPTDFNPPPSIDSAIIAIEAKKDTLSGTALANYYETVGILFQQPRKTILNNLADGFTTPKEKALALLKEANLLGTERPENLTIETIQKISTLTH
jgi:16S rRNA (adenine1518-N6/adenine1519-N6)-dimethyltransferase